MEVVQKRKMDAMDITASVFARSARPIFACTWKGRHLSAAFGEESSMFELDGCSSLALGEGVGALFLARIGLYSELPSPVKLQAYAASLELSVTVTRRDGAVAILAAHMPGRWQDTTRLGPDTKISWHRLDSQFSLLRAEELHLPDDLPVGMMPWREVEHVPPSIDCVLGPCKKALKGADATPLAHMNCTISVNPNQEDAGFEMVDPEELAAAFARLQWTAPPARRGGAGAAASQETSSASSDEEMSEDSDDDDR